MVRSLGRSVFTRTRGVYRSRCAHACFRVTSSHEVRVHVPGLERLEPLTLLGTQGQFVYSHPQTDSQVLQTLFFGARTPLRRKCVLTLTSSHLKILRLSEKRLF